MSTKGKKTAKKKTSISSKKSTNSTNIKGNLAGQGGKGLYK